MRFRLHPNLPMRSEHEVTLFSSSQWHQSLISYVLCPSSLPKLCVKEALFLFQEDGLAIFYHTFLTPS